MDMTLSGRRAVITGASRGIGRAIALRCASLGSDVAIIYASGAAAAEETAELARQRGVKAEIYKCDVSDYAMCAEVVSAIRAELGGIDILVNNAGINRDALTPLMSEADFDAVISVNLKGCFNMIRHCCRSLMRARGRIINITSVAALTGNVGQINYSASKAGIIGMTKTVARELASKGVTCNAIAPGFIISDMTAAMSGEAQNAVTARIPAGRAGMPEEVADAAVFLASDMAAYITGEVIRVDGGMCM